MNVASLQEQAWRFLRGDASYLHDPHPFYGRLRENAPVLRLGDKILVSSYSAVCHVLRNPDVFRSRPRMLTGNGNGARDVERRVPEGAAVFEARFLSRLDGSEHRRLRQAAAGTWAQASGRRRELSSASLNSAVAGHSVGARLDAMSLASHQAISLTSTLLGGSVEDGRRLSCLLRELVQLRRQRPLGARRNSKSADQLIEAITTGASELIWGREVAHADTVTAEVRDAVRRGAMSTSEAVATVALMVLAGVDTTRAAIGNAVLVLLTHPEQLDTVSANPRLTRHAAAELLRFEPPVQVSTRWAAATTTIDSVEIGPGTQILLLLAAANRDPELTADPVRFDPTRIENRSVTFGLGSHRCLGAQVATAEVETMIEVVAAGRLRLAEQLTSATIPRPAGLTLRCPANLPVTISGRDTR